MKEFVIGRSDGNQRLNKYLARVLGQAPQSFLYKMLRKKNITLNGKKAEGHEVLSVGDTVTFYLSDETFAKFSGAAGADAPFYACDVPLEARSVRYEDENLLIAYKPLGVLSQKDISGVPSINEMILQYLSDKGEITVQSVLKDKPSICNRLDRNTSGLVVFAKNLPAKQEVGALLKQRTLQKYYLCFVAGEMKQRFSHKGYLWKDELTNTVVISDSQERLGAEVIETEGTPIATRNGITLVRIRLHTGKSHQIRAVLEHLGYPVIGDPKYTLGRLPKAREIAERYQLRAQLLLAYELRFPKLDGVLAAVSEKRFFSPIPESFHKVLLGEFGVKSIAEL